MSKQVRDRTLVAILMTVIALTATIIGWRLYVGGPVAEAKVETFVKRFAVKVPQPWQLIQRDDNDRADIPVHLVVYGGLSGKISARWNGGKWQVLVENFKGSDFNGFLKDQKVGQGDLEIKLAGITRVVKTVSIGALFITAGSQSNIAAVLTNQHVFSEDLIPIPSMFDLVTTKWEKMCDPVNPYASMLGGGKKGSVWILVAEQLTKKYGVPIGILDSSLVMAGLTVSRPGTPDNDWKREHHLYSNLVQAVKIATAGDNRFEAAFCYGLETDAVGGINTETLLVCLRQFRADLVKDFGGREFPIIVGKIAYFNYPGMPRSNVESVRAAQEGVVDGVKFLAGPDGSLVPIGHDGIHFSGEEAAEIFATSWVDSVEPLFTKRKPGVLLANKP